MSKKRQSYMRYTIDGVKEDSLDAELQERKAKRLAVMVGDVTVLPLRQSVPTVPGDVINDRDVIAIGGGLTAPSGAGYSPPADDGSPTSGCEEISHVTEVGDIKVILDEVNLWKTFYKCGTEMIINRHGRRMFPAVAVSITGLNPSACYKIKMDIVAADDRRYKYVNNRWTAVGKADPQIHNPPYIHPDSPSTGRVWMQSKVSFSKIKITNNKESEEGNVLIHSMHKYMSQITIVPMRNCEEDAHARYVFPLPLTTFVAVTAYQSENIVQMKIRNNPFAKAFRDSDWIGRINRQSADGLIHSRISDKETEIAQNLTSSNRSYPRDYPAIVAPPGRSLVRPEVINYCAGVPGALLVPPGGGIPNLSLYERNEATYRWLCACSQNLTAQAQSIRMRALAMIGHCSLPVYETRGCANASEFVTAQSRPDRRRESPDKVTH